MKKCKKVGFYKYFREICWSKRIINRTNNHFYYGK